MSAKGFVLFGIVWLALACLVFFFVLKRDFAFGFVGMGPRGMAAFPAFTYVLVFVSWVILLGWTVPLAYGAYRIFKH
jgi:hypothetical protein